MKGQGSTNKFTGEERVHSGAGSLFKKFFEKAAKPPIKADLLKDAKKTVASEAKAEINTAISQIFGIELKAGKAVSLAKESKKQEDSSEKPKMTSEHMSYFAEFKRNSENKTEDGTTMAIRQQLDSILAELRNLKDSSDELENVFKDVVIDEVPQKPGIYHLTFYEGFLKLVIKMKDKVQDGVTYAKLFKSRKQEKSYSSMAKKGGTSFTMHHDRAVATQTG